MVSIGPRQLSAGTVEIKQLFHRPVRLLALVKHITSSICFALLCYIYVMLSATNTRALQVFSPTSMGGVVAFLAVLNTYGLVRTCQVRAPRSRLYYRDETSSFYKYISPSSQLMLFHSVDVFCQSFQAYRVSEYFVDRRTSFLFALVVSLNCLVTPWFLLSKHKVVRMSVVPLVESLVGFVLSILFPLVVAILPALATNFSQIEQSDNKFNMRMVLLSRWVLISSPLDLATKVAIQLSSYNSLRKLVESMNIPKQINIPKDLASDHQHSRFQLEFHHHRASTAYVLCVFLWGVALLTTSIAANWFRISCPSTCDFEISPWWTTTCECAYVEINCAKLNVSGESIDRFLRPNELGEQLICIDVRRCALPQGIPPSTLAPFQRLFSLIISYSNMTEWSNGPDNTGLPLSVTNLFISYSNLTSTPTILASVPANLAYLLIEGAAINSILDSYIVAWATVPSIFLNQINLTAIPPAFLTRTTLLERLDLRGNSIHTIPTEWQPQSNNLKILDLSGNAILDAPWDLVNSGCLLELSSTSISSVPAFIDIDLLQKRNIVLDDTPYCSSSAAPAGTCERKCAPLCQVKMQGNGKCDWPCYIAACQFDRGDCDSYGFGMSTLPAP
ncbi:Aste57867_13045 [Aphanomyces stellatus]|uniref:Aste57867_13045 protein n=1 Tax=Aphanomyces stellatus TaxID=120398 RepID=A0A485KY12_9STRA|nr:hypothetical protein As57867_012997 [Aphanomyces stellatus]VFT89890.1 Aste57867_13045 [Aphanomyces stellatus]